MAFHTIEDNNNLAGYLKMFTFRRSYFWLTIIILCIEISIAVFIKDRFIRPYVGDILAALLVYCFIRTFFNLTVARAAMIALCFSVLIEILQYINIVKILGLEHATIARIALGNSFDWKDMLMYLIGILLALGVERSFTTSLSSKKIKHKHDDI